MIEIQFFQNSSNNYTEIIMTGHAGYADKGYDIVCAAVSSQIISVENSLTTLLDIGVRTQVDEVAGGYLKLTLPKDISPEKNAEAQLLLRHLYFAYEVLAANYPEFITLKTTNIPEGGVPEC